MSTSTSTSPRPLVDADLAPLLDLNNTHAVALSLLDADGFAAQLGRAWHVRTVGEPGAPLAMLLALDHEAGYVNPNFEWIAARYPEFVYIDRIVVDDAAAGRGLARTLYEDLFETAKARGLNTLICEINVEPPNPASTAFHTKLGFKEIGRQKLPNGKTVAYFERKV